MKRIIYDESRSLDERDEAVEELRGMAEDGDSHAQYLMGKLYRDGPLLIPDMQLALDWFTRAAEQELPIAQYILGKLYLSNDIEVRDPGRGMDWLERAAQNDNDYAAYRLGKEYLRGRVVEKDVFRAMEWFTQAAESGNSYAQYMPGINQNRFRCRKILNYFIFLHIPQRGIRLSKFGKSFIRGAFGMRYLLGSVHIR